MAGWLGSEGLYGLAEHVLVDVVPGLADYDEHAVATGQILNRWSFQGLPPDQRSDLRAGVVRVVQVAAVAPGRWGEPGGNQLDAHDDGRGGPVVGGGLRR